MEPSEEKKEGMPCSGEGEGKKCTGEAEEGKKCEGMGGEEQVA